MRSVLGLIAGLWCGQLSAQPFNDALVQAPQLDAPRRGSLVGQYAATELGPADVSRGGFSLASTFAVPMERGVLQAQVFPTYSPEGGIGEWGQGWGVSLAVTRARVIGELDYVNDDLTGPWGRMVKGTDGRWYPVGLKGNVLMEEQGDSLVALLPDGSRWTFGGTARVQTARGTYAWHLTQVEDVTGHRTKLEWTANASGRLFLTAALYGGLGNDFQGRVDFIHEPVTPFVDWRSGQALRLDRRVSRVEVRSKDAVTGQFGLRWTYALGYHQDALGPAFRLESVQRTYASGQSTPAVTYTYERAEDLLPAVAPRFIPKFDGVMLAYSEGVALPSESTPLDDGEDGLVDLEHRTDFSLIRQRPEGYTFEALPPPAPDARPECRPDPSVYNQPRLLARMRPQEDDYQVVSLSWNGYLSKTELLVCERDGHPVHQGWLDDLWQLGPNTRLVDLNRDWQPELLDVFPGGYRVLPNQSTAATYAFGAIAVTGTLDLQVPPEATWVHDFNGDSVADLVVRYSNVLLVYAGKGQFLFEQEPQLYEALFPDGTPVSLWGFELSFTDVNNDGLKDVIAGAWSGALLLVNDGTRLVQVPVPALELLAWTYTYPVVQDLEGTGNTELFFVQNGLGHSVALDTPGTGLMKSADDGKGTRLSFTYARSPVAPRQGARQPVLATLTVESSGQEPKTHQYTYGQPVMHSVGRFLLGYGQVTRQGTHVQEEMHFLNDDDSAGLPVASWVRDDKASRVEQFSTSCYDDAWLAGLRWKRLRTREQGWRSTTDSQQVSERTEYQAYTADVCPSRVVTTTAEGALTTERTRASVAGLGLALHCLESHTVLTGQHAQAWMDFRHESVVERDSRGLVEAVRSVAGSQTLTLQEVTYHPDGALDSISVPGKGVAYFHQEPGRRLLFRTEAPDGVVTRVVDRDPLTDAVLTLEVDRGGTPYRRFFRYDGQERLSREWDSLGGSELNPKQTYGYQYATAATPGSFQLSTLVDGAQGAVRESIEYVTASGDAFTSARRIPEGWTFDSLTRRDGARAELRTLLRSAVGPSANMLAMDYAALLAGSRQVAFSSASAFGHDAATTTAFHEDVEKQVATSLGFEAGALTQTAVENGVFTASRVLDAARRVLIQEDEAHTRYAYRYDASGRLREVVLPDGATHRVYHDGHGRVDRLVRQGIASVEYSYDATKDRLIQKRYVSPSGAVQRQVDFGYDTLGRPSTETHTAVPGGESLVYRYYHDGASPSGPATLDQKGYLTAVSGEGYVKLFTYRTDGKLLSRTLVLDGWRTVQTQLDYNDAGDLSSSTVVVKAADGTLLSSDTQVYKLDAYGRLEEAWLGTGGAPAAPWASLEYDGEGRVSSVDFTGGTHVGFGYDDLTRRRITQVQSTPTWSASTAQRLNARGLVESEDFTVGAQTWQRDYTYWPQGFLAQAQDAHDSYAYAYAPEGLPLSIEENGTSRTVTRSGSTLTVGNVTYTFDTLGRAVTKGDLELTYGPNGHVATATRGTTEWHFLYDEMGQRILKLEGTTPVAAYLEAGEYLDASGLTLPVHFAGQLVGVIQQGTFRPLAADTRGTLLTDTMGAPFVASPYGNRTAHPDVSPALDFVQKGYDADLGLIRMGVRDYDATLGQFLTPDPLFLESPEMCLASPSECNLYSYARGNPTGFTDPSGKCAASQDRGIDCLGPALAQGAAVEQEMVQAWNDGNYGTASVAAVLGVSNGALVVSMFLVQGVLDVGNGTYIATSGFMEGNYDKALNGSVQTLAAFTFARMGQASTALSAELSPTGRLMAGLTTSKSSSTTVTNTVKSVCGSVGCGGPGTCFVAGTLVIGEQGTVPIEQIQLGDRVEAGNAECAERHIAPDAVTIRLELPNPKQPLDVISISVVRPYSWLAEEGLRDGKVWLDLPELELAGWARVVSVKPAPREASGKGCLVLATFEHVASEVLRVRFAGGGKALEVTPPHPLYVEGRGWTPARELVAGMWLRSDTGRVLVESVEPASSNQRVYNIEVDLEHTYRVTESSIWAHNNYAAKVPGPLSAGKNFKEHFIDKRPLVERALGMKIGKLKDGGGDALLKALGEGIDNGTFSYVGQGTLKKGSEAMNIYRGGGLTVVTKPNGEWVTTLTTGEGMDLAIQML